MTEARDFQRGLIKMNANIENIIENINDYVLGDCSAKQCGFSDEEVNEIFSTLISESGKKVLENAVKALSDEDYDEIVEKIAKTIYIARKKQGKHYIADMDFYYALQNEATEKGWEFYQDGEGGDIHLKIDSYDYANEQIDAFLANYPELQNLYEHMLG
jgi:hypothetical protein